MCAYRILCSLMLQELLLADMHGSLGTNPISSGTFGTVESTCTGHLGPVVCKWVVNLDEEAAKALDVEAGNLASFRHPSIVAYYGRVVDPILRPSQMGIVMECMDSTLCPLITAGYVLPCCVSRAGDALQKRSMLDCCEQTCAL